MRKRGEYLVILFVFLSSIYLYSRKTPPLKKQILAISLPFMKALKCISCFVDKGFSNIFDLLYLREENRVLKRRIRELEMAEKRELRVISEYKKLLKISELNKIYRQKVIFSKIIGLSYGSQTKIGYISKGSLDGICQGEAVVSEKGLVGRIIDVSKNFSTVMFITDKNSYIEVKIGKHTKGLLSGTGSSKRCIVKFVERFRDVRVGDMVTTSRTNTFPEGIPVGRVLKVVRKERDLFLEIVVKPFVDPKSLEWVGVVKW